MTSDVVLVKLVAVLVTDSTVMLVTMMVDVELMSCVLVIVVVAKICGFVMTDILHIQYRTKVLGHF